MGQQEPERRSEVSEPRASFIGVDLAWHGNGRHTGLAVLRQHDSSLVLAQTPGGARSDEEILAFVDTHSSGATVVAIDAPLIVTNQTSQRPCETKIGQLFGENEASAHTSNLTLFPNPGGVRLAKALQAKGFAHPTPQLTERNPNSRLMAEVYPHPSQIRLFGLQTTLKYKKGRVADRRAALGDYRTRLKASLDEAGFQDTDISSSFFSQSIEPLKGKRLKEYEDQLDALFCALLAFRLWAHGWTKSEIIGDLETGYIVVPRKRDQVEDERSTGDSHARMYSAPVAPR
jgi:predicted RNase H-like nuclease